MPRPSVDVRNLTRLPHLPFILLILVNLFIGILTFQVYGASWDEPGFYRYASSIPYAYSIQERLTGQFQIEKAFGPPKEGNKMYGPAFLLMAGGLVKILISVFQQAWYPSWHLINFLSFQAGIIFFYLLCLRWMSRRAAFTATLLFSTQPILWGHAFINPKDIPFMSFFLATIYLGFWGIDRLGKEKDLHQKFATRLADLFLNMLPAGLALGLLASIRMLGPFAGVLIALYAFIKYGRRSIPNLVIMALITILVNYLTWPYLWNNPIARYLEVFQYMSKNPVIVSVLFQGIFYRSNHLPSTYFPVMVFINFTEVVWLLFFSGLTALAWKQSYKKIDWQSLLPVLLWFLLPFFYVITYKPPLYDGLRHFMFILPPIFIFTGFAFERLFTWVRKTWMQVILVTVMVCSGVFGILRLFPYEYTYYNSFVGGTGGAFRRFETDFWLTCYKEALEEIQKTRPEVTKVYVLRNPDLAAEVADDSLLIEDLWPVKDKVPEGSVMLFTTRFDDDQNIRYYEPLVLSVGRAGADFCIVRQVGE
jgi:hypothetical protein